MGGEFEKSLAKKNNLNEDLLTNGKKAKNKNNKNNSNIKLTEINTMVKVKWQVEQN